MQFNDQPNPTKNSFPACWDLVINDINTNSIENNPYNAVYSSILAVAMQIVVLNELKNGNKNITLDEATNRIIQLASHRDNFGLEKYGVRLQPFNDRDFLKDSLEEVLDLMVYFRGFIYERANKEQQNSTN